MDWGETDSKNGFVSYALTIGKMARLQEKSVQDCKGAHRMDGSLTTLRLATVPEFFSVDRLLVGISVARRDYDEYIGFNVSPELASVIAFVTLLDQIILWAQARDAVELLKEKLNAIKVLVKRLYTTVQVLKKCYINLVYQSVRGVKEDCRKPKVDRHELANREKKREELRSKIQLLVDDWKAVTRFKHKGLSRACSWLLHV